MKRQHTSKSIKGKAIVVNVTQKILNQSSKHLKKKRRKGPDMIILIMVTHLVSRINPEMQCR